MNLNSAQGNIWGAWDQICVNCVQGKHPAPLLQFSWLVFLFFLIKLRNFSAVCAMNCVFLKMFGISALYNVYNTA